jgi:hypothetical protein
MADIGAGVAGRVGGGQGGQARLAMHWTPIMSAFVLYRFADLVGERVKTERGFKEVLLNNVARQVLSFLGRRSLGHMCTTTYVSGASFGLGFASLRT